MKIHILNGPNLDLLGRREPSIYGSETFEAFFERLRKTFESRAELFYFQSNWEGALIDELHRIGIGAERASGVLLNAGGLSHTSVALADAVGAIESPVLEIHISNVHAREAYRHRSFLSAKCVGQIVGLGLDGYRLGAEWLVSNVR